MNPENNRVRRDTVPLDKMVHDLLQSLRSISLNVQRMQRMPGLSEAASHLEAISGAVRDQETLLRCLSEIGYASEVGLVNDSRVPLDVAIQTACMRVETFRASHSGKIEIGDVVEAQVPSGISKIFERVLHNGLKFHRQGVDPVVRVETRIGSSGEGRHLFARFIDNGIGIATHQRTRVLEPFTRLNPVSVYAGSALGLATCRLLIESIGGHIVLGDTGNGDGVAVEILTPAGVYV